MKPSAAGKRHAIAATCPCHAGPSASHGHVGPPGLNVAYDQPPAIEENRVLIGSVLSWNGPNIC